MTRPSLHALALSIVFCIAAAAGAALPQDRPFQATIKTGAPGAEQCLGFANGDANPSRSNEHCAPAWRLLPLGNDLYTVSYESAAGEQCLIFGGNGSETSPSRFTWDIGAYCGFPGGKDALLRNRQAVFHIVDLGDGYYTMANASAGSEQCVIFGSNGGDRHPSRYNWGSGAHCGFPGGREELLRNGQGVFRIEPSGSADILDELWSQLYANDQGRYYGLTYQLTSNNAIIGSWLLQTPYVWGKEASAVPDGAGRGVAEHVTDVISKAQQHVDIMTLVPFPTGEFQAAVRRGLESLARSGRPVTVRILAGWDPATLNSTNQGDYLRSLIVDIQDRTRYPHNRLQISVAAQRTVDVVWNHGKIVAVDGREMIVGGQNLWDSDYLRQNPVHDINIRFQGSGVMLGHRYADEVWSGPCAYVMPSWKPALWRAGEPVTTGCLARPSIVPPPRVGSARMLTVARLGLSRVSGMEASELAMVTAFEKTSGPIYIAQQDVMGTLFWDWIKPLATAVVKQDRPVTIVVGDDGARGGPAPGSTYKLPGRTLHGLAVDLWNGAKAIRGSMTIEQLRDRLCTRLSVAPLRFGPSQKWPSGLAFANHAKFWMIGDLFYVGSHNMYPAGLQEIGVIVNDAPSAAKLNAEYWQPLWQWSKAAAISGEPTRQCVFRGMS